MITGILTLSALSSCAQGTGNGGTVTDGTGSGTPGTSAPAVVTDELYKAPGVKYNGQELLILMTTNATDAFNDITGSDSLSDILSDAAEKRLSSVEELLGVKISAEEIFKYGSHGYNKMLACYTSGSADYDLSFISAYDVVPLAYTNCLYDLISMPGIDTERSWWDQKANSELSVGGVLFFTTGDIACWDDTQQYVVAFNKDVFEKYSASDGYPDSVYTLVNDGGWTLDAMYTMAKPVTQDLDGGGLPDVSDAFGIITWDDTIYGILGGAGEKVVRNDKGTDTLCLSLIGNERAVNAMTLYTEICFSGNAINYQRYTEKDCDSMFTDGRALFYLNRLVRLDKFRDMSTDYGILPYPKADETQAEYYTTVSPYHMNFFCRVNLEDGIECAGYTAEALAYYGQKYITPAYNERTLVGTYTRDNESVGMLSLLTSSRCYDIGFYIQPDNINKELIYMFRAGSTDYVSTFDRKAQAAETAVNQVNAAFASAVAEWKK